MFSILVVDDDISVRRVLIKLLQARSYRVSGAATEEEALRRIKEEVYDLVITDLKIGVNNSSGMDILRTVKQIDPTVEVIVLTGFGTIESSVEAMKLGAFDYVLKPLSEDEFIVRVERALSRKQMAEEIERLKERLRKENEFETIIARSKEMNEILQLVAKVGKSDSPIMLQGESGTGKELIARAIHRIGRPEGPFVPINCSALP
ncbi:sigma-54-dependent Fis family transcriptional regulator, partial [Candidatus Poribacteria bacterium]|nr:sigma-54-dependent Fis family transcriptional regulator [Candidatus Poribacteria bacterium]